MTKKKIVLLSDGTGNSSAKAQKTNVWRIYQALDLSNGKQIARYDDGVGTSSNRYLALAGGAFGWGLKRNLLDLYMFVCRNYRPGDEIYGLGFSRGAFTIRVLVGLIANEGLVTARSEEELARNAIAAYRHYRSNRFPSWSPIVLALRRLRDAALRARDRIKGYATYDEVAEATAKAGRKDIRIKFLGLWDTVEAYGVPIPELKRGIDWVLWPMMFGDQKLSPLVDRACHALSLDDERTTFHPIVWDEEAEALAVRSTDPRQRVRRGRITQVWFAGVHSNVGGGYPEDQLSLVSLKWIMHEAMESGLALETDAVSQVSRTQSAYARLYDSRAGLAAYYRYSPRSIPAWRLGTEEILPIVHGSVVLRMAGGIDRYAPIALPHRFWVLAQDGKLLPMEGFAQELQLDATKACRAGAALGAKTKIPGARSELQQAMEQLARPERERLSLVWDTVWWRGVFYFIAVGLTAILALYPWLGGVFAEMLGDRFHHWLQTGSNLSRPTLTTAVDALSGFIPGYTRPWAEALERHPVMFVALSVLLGLTLFKSKKLQTQISDRAWFAWHDSPSGRADAEKEHQPGWRGGAVVFAVAACLLLAAFLCGAPRGDEAVLIAITAIVFPYVIWRLAKSFSVGRASARPGPVARPSTFGMILARRIRQNKILQTSWRWIFQRVVPITFAFGLIVLGLLIGNRVLFDVASAAGFFCPEEKNTGGDMTFRTDALCFPTGVEVVEGRRYRITLTTDGNWFDRTDQVDVEGFASNNWLRYLGTPLKRWWGENWFKPIARIGRLGNDEYVLTPVDPLEPHAYCTDPERFGQASSSASGPVTPSPAAACNSQASEWAAEQCKACASCLPQAPQATGAHSISAKISDRSAQELMRCSPTPKRRKTLVADIVARSSGMLFIYVNDAVLGLSGLFYGNNAGTAKIDVIEQKTLPESPDDDVGSIGEGQPNARGGEGAN